MSSEPRSSRPNSAPPSFEQEVREHLRAHGLRHTDHTDAFYEMDFSILLSDAAHFHLELKEKRQHYAMEYWPAFAPEAELFILDDLTVRKALAFSPRAGVAVKDWRHNRYLFFSVVDLALMPRLRVNRKIARNQPDVKGKWLIDLRNGRSATTVADLIDQVRIYLENLHVTLFEEHGCYGAFTGETLGEGGTTRTAGYWDQDVRDTR